ncbi:class I SAM-dependent methyltransferase [Pareuzebyella sediminis]|uniref:class I SAM-dependent methyltransferase n=1 Tax=Pareuzebyella sediminis TaxID=2607998 RepID=UPI0011EBF6E9|nr:class I SAM-dependent methyltransferase [Pareuzebyella sediminis]
MRQVAQDWNVELYNSKHAFVFDYGRSLIDALQPQSHERILDLGCGSGILTKEIADSTGNVIGVDKSADMIASARASFPEISFEIGDVGDFSFKAPFDAIFSNATLHWVLQSDQAIENMYANLKKGGRIVLEFGGKDNIKTIIQALRHVLSEKGFEKQARVTPWFFPSIGEYTHALEHYGFRVTFAHLYDRPTALVDSETGIVDWLMMFATAFFEGMEEDEVLDVAKEVQNQLRPELFKSGKWYADYRRIRIIAHKD